MSTPEYTVKEYAAQERVDERTVRRWILKGAVYYRRTAGGGIRILGVPPRAPDPAMASTDIHGHS